MWTVLFQAHKEGEQSVAAARAQLLQRYCGAVYRYLYAVLRDANAADELAQEFALRFLKGGFKGADPSKGRFRDYVKAVLFNLIRDHKKKQQRQEVAIDMEGNEPAVDPDSFAADGAFLNGWRDELLARTWEALAKYERESGRMYHTTLDYRTRHPDISSAQMAEVFTERFGKPFTAPAVRQTTHRAREKFGDLLVEEVSRSLESADAAAIEQELIDLGLHTYCQDAVRRWAAARA
jgi:RNA polymerase sigma-70 factor (ECF subfamily)